MSGDRRRGDRELEPVTSRIEPTITTPSTKTRSQGIYRLRSTEGSGLDDVVRLIPAFNQDNTQLSFAFVVPARRVVRDGSCDR